MSGKTTRGHAAWVFGCLAALGVSAELWCGTGETCSGDWDIEVAEGTPVIEYPGVPLERRGQCAELAPDLIIAPEDPDHALYRPFTIAVDDRGRIFVGEHGVLRVQVFTRTVASCFASVAKGKDRVNSRDNPDWSSSGNGSCISTRPSSD